VQIYGDDGADTVIVGSFDSVWGLGGDDLIVLSTGADSTTYVDGGAGNDAVRVSTGGDIAAMLVSIENLDLSAVDVAVTLRSGSYGQVSVDGDTLTISNTTAGAAAIALSDGLGLKPLQLSAFLI